MFGGGRAQPSSAEKIAAAETEVEMVSDMFNRYYSPFPDHPKPPSPSFPSKIANVFSPHLASHNPALRNVYRPSTAKPISTKARAYVWTDA